MGLACGAACAEGALAVALAWIAAAVPLLWVFAPAALSTRRPARTADPRMRPIVVSSDATGPRATPIRVLEDPFGPRYSTSRAST